MYLFRSDASPSIQCIFSGRMLLPQFNVSFQVGCISLNSMYLFRSDASPQFNVSFQVRCISLNSMYLFRVAHRTTVRCAEPKCHYKLQRTEWSQRPGVRSVLSHSKHYSHRVFLQLEATNDDFTAKIYWRAWHFLSDFVNWVEFLWPQNRFWASIFCLFCVWQKKKKIFILN